MDSFVWTFGDIRALSIVSIMLRFTIAIICGGVIGMERGRKQHAAGLRTHLLVCIGSAGTMMLSQYMIVYFGVGDPARLGAQVISGIGFLGVGTIIVTGRSQVKGLTTAAGLWASACMGLAIGIGFYEGAIIMCISMYIVLEVLFRVDEEFVKYANSLTLYLEMDTNTPFSRVLTLLHTYGWRVSNLERMGTCNEQYQSLLLYISHEGKKHDNTGLFLALRTEQGILFVEEM